MEWLLVIFTGAIIGGIVWTWQLWRYASALPNTVPDSAFLLDLQGRVRHANSAFCQWLRVSPQEVNEKPINVVIPELHPYITPRPKKALRQEFQYRGRYFELVVVPTRPNRPNASPLLISFRDMTLRKHAEMILLSNERRYRALFENSNDAIFIVDLDGSILIANTPASVLLGLPLDDLLRYNITRFFAHKADETHFFASVEDQHRAPLYERTLRHHNGTLIHTEVNQTLVRDNDGEPLHVQMVVRDVTARKHAESELHNRIEQLSLLRQVDDEMSSTLDSQRLGELALDLLTRLTLADAGFVALSREEEVSITHVIGKYNQTHLGLPILLDRGIAGRVLIHQEAEMVLDVHKDPDYILNIPSTKAVMVLPLISQERLIGIIMLESAKIARFTPDVFQVVQLIANRIATAMDSAFLYQYTLEQLQAIQLLYHDKSRLEQLKTDMIRIASHDLRNPLSIIMGYLTIFSLDRDNFDPSYYSFFDAMETSANRMHRILEDILSLERIEQQARDSATMPFNLSQQVQRALEEYMPQALQHQLTLSSLVDPELVVQGDEAQVYEAVTNLISNAIKYTPAGGMINVCLKRQEATARFEVQDTGFGIPQEKQDRLFQPFYRAKMNETSEIEGTGLGLHLVKNIIERHRGTLIFQSVYGKGSQFGFSLPLVGMPVVAS